MMVVQFAVQFLSCRTQLISEGSGSRADVERGTEVAGGPWVKPAKIGYQGTLPRYLRQLWSKDS